MDAFAAQLKHYRAATSGDSAESWYFSVRQLARQSLASTGRSTVTLDQDF